MQIGDVVLTKTDTTSDLRWLGVVSEVRGDFVEMVMLCTTEKDGRRVLYSLDARSCRDAADLVLIGHVDQSLISEEVSA